MKAAPVLASLASGAASGATATRASVAAAGAPTAAAPTTFGKNDGITVQEGTAPHVGCSPTPASATTTGLAVLAIVTTIHTTSSEVLPRVVPTRLSHPDLQDFLRRYLNTGRILAAKTTRAAKASSTPSAPVAALRPDNFHLYSSFRRGGIGPGGTKRCKGLHALPADTPVRIIPRTDHPAFAAMLWILLRLRRMRCRTG